MNSQKTSYEKEISLSKSDHIKWYTLLFYLDFRLLSFPRPSGHQMPSRRQHGRDVQRHQQGHDLAMLLATLQASSDCC